MAEINAKDLTAKTSPASTDSMLLFGTTSNEGAKITVDNLADNILSRLTTKTFANQVGGSSAATILAQLATLNSKFTGFVDITDRCTAGENINLQRVRAARLGSLTAVYVYFTPTEGANLSNCTICTLPNDYTFTQTIYTAGTSDNVQTPYTFELAAQPGRLLRAYFLQQRDVPYLGMIIA